MTATEYDSAAIIVLPAAGGGLLRDASLRRWLSRSALAREAAMSEPLARVLRAAGQSDPGTGLAALRFWGQTGDRPGAWIAAADPVHFEPGLSRIRLHRLSPDELPVGELRELYDGLQAAVGEGGATGFACIERLGYLTSAAAFPTPALSAECLHGQEPEPHMPRGAAAAAYMRLLSEIQMVLHASPVSHRREAEGRHAINSLWIWGGGIAPEARARRIPPLFTDDPLLRGYWHSAAGVVDEWAGTLEGCLEAAPDGFVALVPEGMRTVDEHVEALQVVLAEARRLLRDSALGRLTLLFRDGLTARIERRHRFRFWARESPLLEAGDAG